MASIGGDRDKLLKAFLDNAKRKRKPGKPGRIRTGTPQPGQGENVTFKRLGNKPPPRVYAPHVVPGYGDYIHEKAARKIGQVNARSDRSRPFTQPTGHSERLPDYPGGSYKRPRRPKRPRWD